MVLELSSFQLFDLEKSPHIAVVLMITAEHLDWHINTREYRGAKEAIVKYQTAADYTVINQDFSASKSFAKISKAKVFFISTKSQTNGVFIQDDKICSNISAAKEKIASTSDILLPGAHNLQNVLAAVAVAKILGVDNSTILGVLATFPGLEHRLQLTRDIKGIKFYNDSFSTIPETTIAAIDAFTRPKILILGGSSKKSDFRELGKKIIGDKTIKAIVIIGQEGKRILAAISKAGVFKGRTIKGAKNMKSIVQRAYEIAQSGDVIILSPACASFDMFKNYKDRGEQFIREVKKLK